MILIPIDQLLTNYNKTNITHTIYNVNVKSTKTIVTQAPYVFCYFEMKIKDVLANFINNGQSVRIKKSNNLIR